MLFFITSFYFSVCCSLFKKGDLNTYFIENMQEVIFIEFLKNIIS